MLHDVRAGPRELYVTLTRIDAALQRQEHSKPCSRIKTQDVDKLSLLFFALLLP